MCASGYWIFSWIFEFAEKQQAETAPERRHGRSKAARKKKALDKEEEVVEEHTVWACREKPNRREKNCREPEDWNKPWTIACDSCRGWWRGVHAGFPVEQPENNKSVPFVCRTCAQKQQEQAEDAESRDSQNLTLQDPQLSWLGKISYLI